MGFKEVQLITGTTGFTMPSGMKIVEYVVVASGGRGGGNWNGWSAGGAGAGGLVSGSTMYPTGGQYNAVVGGGGSYVGNPSSLSGASIFATAWGGGNGAGAYNYVGYGAGTGGSGGGGCGFTGDEYGTPNYTYRLGATGLTGQGYDGQRELGNIAGGGGGAGSKGYVQSWAGGFGLWTYITETPIYLAPGGGVEETPDTDGRDATYYGGGGWGAHGGVHAAQGGEGKQGVVIVNYRTYLDDTPTVTTDSVTGYTDTSALAGGTVTDTGATTITARGFAWGTTENPTITADNFTVETGVTESSFNTILTGLTEGQLYYARAYATNSHGTAYGANYLFFPPYYDGVSLSGFTSNGSMIIPSGFTRMEYLLVAGGGGGGGAKSECVGGYYSTAWGGAGGAGGVLNDVHVNITPGTYPVVIGAGGAGGSSTPGDGTNGGNTTFYGYTAIGGGRGAYGKMTSGCIFTYGSCGNGGSGGAKNTGGCTGTAGQGHNAGTKGGGGAGSAGGNNEYSAGDGIYSDISGVNTYYARGGGGYRPTPVKGEGGRGSWAVWDGHTVSMGGSSGQAGVVYVLLYNPQKPEAPTGLTASDITCTGATLTWVNTDETEVTGISIQYNSGGTWVNVGSVASTATTYNLSGLNPLTSYEFRVTADNELYFTPSDGVNFTTLDPAPYNLGAIPQAGYANLTWELNDPPFGDSIRPEIRLSGGTWTGLTTIAHNATGYTFTGLSSFTDYGVRFVRIWGSEEYPSLENNFKTLYFNQPTDLSVTGITFTTAVLNWTNNNTSDVLGNRIEIYSGGTWVTWDTVASGDTSYNITGLTEDTSYVFRVVVYNAGGEVASNSIGFSTANLLAPSGLTATLITIETARVSWTNNNTSNVAENRIEIYSGGTWVTWDTVASGDTYYDFTGLTYNTEYTVRVVAVSTGGAEEPSDELVFSTLNIFLADVELQSISGIDYYSGRTASRVWDIGNDPTTTRGICWSATNTVPTTGDSLYVGTGSGLGGYNSYMTGLTDTTTYYVRAWAYNRAGLAYSDEILEFATLTITTPIVRTLRVSGVTYSQADGVGEVIDDGYPIPILNYGLCWNSTGNPDINDSTSQTTADFNGEFLKTMYYLVPNMTYYVRAYATNAKGVGYGRVIAFTTLGSKGTSFLRFSDGLIWDMEIKDFEVNYSLTDIKNIADSKTSFTMPIKLPYTPDVVERFGILFNVNSLSDITDQKVECKLVHKNNVIIDGYLYVEDWNFEYINVIVARNDIGIFEDIRNLSLADLNFTGSTYSYTGKSMNDHSTDMFEFYVSGSTGFTDHKFVWFDWWGDSDDLKRNYSKNEGTFSKLGINRDLTPVLKVKTVFDKIFEEAGYTYSGSTEFIEKLDKLYMTTTAPIDRFSKDEVFTKYLFKEDTAVTGYKPISTGTTSGQPVGSSYIKFMIHSGTSVDDKGVSSVYGVPCTSETNPASFSSFWGAFRGGIENEVEITIYAEDTSGYGNGEFTINIYNRFYDYPNGKSLGSITFSDIPTGSTTTPMIKTFTIKPPDDIGFGDFYYVLLETNQANVYSRNDQVGFEDACIKIKQKNHIYHTGNTYTFNDLLSNKYTQTKLLRDLFKEFNLFVYADENNINHLNIKTYNDFYTEDVLDWTNKFSVDGLKVNDTSKELYSQYDFVNEGDDAIEKSFIDFNNQQIYEHDVENNNEVSISRNEKISINRPAIKLVSGVPLVGTSRNLIINRNFDSYYIDDGFKQCIGSYYDKYNSAVMFGYLNTFSQESSNSPSPDPRIYGCYFSGYGYEYGALSQQRFSSVSFETLLTISPFQLTGDTTVPLEITDENCFANVWDTSNSMVWTITGGSITNNTLYNNFWKQDLNKKIDSQQRFLKSHMRLNESDVKIENFRKKIWIENQKLGDAYYRLNKIVYPSNEEKLSYVELTNEVNYDASYSGTTPVTLYDYNYLTSEVEPHTDTISTPTGGTGASYFYFGYNDGNYAVGSASGETAYKTWDLEIDWWIWAEATTYYYESYATSTTRLYYSLNYGSTWTQLDSVSATVYTADTSDDVDKTGTTTIYGISNPQGLYFKADWDFGANNSGGVDYCRMIGVTASSGTASVVCDNRCSGFGGSYKMNISC